MRDDVSDMRAQTQSSPVSVSTSGDRDSPNSDLASDEESSMRHGELQSRVADPGLSDASVERGTGKSWDAWFGILDSWGAASHSHAEIARYLVETHHLGGWWAQGITVGYERARGMRAVHERTDGFSVAVNKMFPVGVERLFSAFTDEATRDRWLAPGTLSHRSAKEYSAARFDVIGTGVRLHLYFTAKNPEKSSVAIELARLDSAEDVEPTRALWKERLTELASFLNALG
ncbi:MAG: hypothetical protein M3R06_07600 [Chloroflexota bacterium]|nr:hypothetical protein [Chloroflexota bacterium]